MTWKLFIDDLRDPLTGGWTVARSSKDCIAVLNVADDMPSVISFDHDLGLVQDSVDDSMRILHWMIGAHLDGFIDLSKVQCVIVHSANPIGAQNIIGLWGSFARSQGFKNCPCATWEPRLE